MSWSKWNKYCWKVHNLLMQKGIKIKFKTVNGVIKENATIASTYVVGYAMNVNVNSDVSETVDIKNIVSIQLEGENIKMPKYRVSGQQTLRL